MARGVRKSRKAGSLGSLVNQAVVPFALVALNQSRKKRGGKRSCKHRGGRRSRRH